MLCFVLLKQFISTVLLGTMLLVTSSEGVKQVSTLIQPRDYGMLLELKDCYLAMGLHPAHRRYCRFRCPEGKRWQWKAVFFGTAEAPQICTKVLRPITRILKSLGVRCLMYIDDLLCLDQGPF